MHKAKVFLYILPLFIVFHAFAQDTVKVGNPNSAQIKRSEVIPFNGKYDYSWSTALYTNDQLTGLEGSIKEIAFHVSNNANYKMHDQKIYARLTTETTSNNSSYPNISDYTLVYSGDITYNGSGYKLIQLNSEFQYETGKNIEFLFENRDGNNKDNCLLSNQSANCVPKFSYMESTTLKGRRDYKDKGFPTDCYMCEVNSRIPIIKFIMPPCKGLSNGEVSTATPSVCSNSSVLLNLTMGNPNATGFNVDWQMSTDQVNWVTQVNAGSGLPQTQFQSNPLINNTPSNTVFYFRARIYKYGIINGMEALCEKFTNIITITVYPAVDILINSNISPACLNASANNIILSASSLVNASTPSYKWIRLSDGSIVSTNATYNPTVPDSYQLEITSLDGCKALSNVIDVFMQPSVTISSHNDLICLSNDLELALSSSSQGVISYEWHLNGTAIANSNQGSWVPLTAGLYELQITAKHGCTALSNSIEIFPSPNVTITAPQNVICANGTVLLSTNISQTPSSGTYTYKWYFNGVLQTGNLSTFIATQPGLYSVTVKNSFGCTGSAQFNLSLTNGLLVDAGPDKILGALTVNIGGSPVASNGNGVYSYHWEPLSGLQNPSDQVLSNPSVAPAATTLYTITVVDGNGCKGSDQVYVFNLGNVNTYAPLKKKLGAGYHFLPSSHKLYFTIDGEYETTALSFNIYDNDNQLIVGLVPNSNMLAYGDNRFSIDMSALATNFYILEVTNQKKEKYYLRFKK